MLQVCTAFCKEGYTISGNATVLICGDAPASSQGYTEFVPGTEEHFLEQEHFLCFSQAAVVSANQFGKTRKAEQKPHIPNRAHNMSCEQWVKIANMINEMPQDSRRLTAKDHHGLKK